MAAADDFSTLGSGLNSPYRHAFAVTPADGADLSHVTRAILVGGAGAVKVDMQGGEAAVTLTGLLAGVVYPVCATRIYSTSTTATNLVGLY